MYREAVISEDQKYRYTLYREWSEDPFEPVKVLNFLMLNPSTADASKEDPTIRKCIGFAKFNGFNAIRVLNLFAFRSTDPKNLKAFYMGDGDVVGPENDSYVREIPRDETVVAAWGSTFKDERFWKTRVRETIHLMDRPLFCLKHTKDEHPYHPLYVPYGPLMRFEGESK